MKRILLLATAVGVLAGCAGREPVLEPTMTAADAEFDCDQLRIAYDDAINRALEKQAKQQSRDNTDAVLGVAGAILFLPALFFIDTKNADGAEARNLMHRAGNLRELAASRECPVTTWRALPEIREQSLPAPEGPERKLNGAEVATVFSGKPTSFARGSYDGYTVRFDEDRTISGDAPGDGGSDTGTWAVEDDRLCMAWAGWDDARRRCYSVYTRDDEEYRLNPGGGRTNLLVTVK